MAPRSPGRKSRARAEPTRPRELQLLTAKKRSAANFQSIPPRKWNEGFSHGKLKTWRPWCGASSPSSFGSQLTDRVRQFWQRLLVLKKKRRYGHVLVSVARRSPRPCIPKRSQEEEEKGGREGGRGRNKTNASINKRVQCITWSPMQLGPGRQHLAVTVSPQEDSGSGSGSGVQVWVWGLGLGSGSDLTSTGGGRPRDSGRSTAGPPPRGSCRRCRGWWPCRSAARPAPTSGSSCPLLRTSGAPATSGFAGGGKWKVDAVKLASRHQQQQQQQQQQQGAQ